MKFGFGIPSDFMHIAIVAQQSKHLIWQEIDHVKQALDESQIFVSHIMGGTIGPAPLRQRGGGGCWMEA